MFVFSSLSWLSMSGLVDAVTFLASKWYSVAVPSATKVFLAHSDNIFASSYIVPPPAGVMVIDVVGIYPVTLFNVVSLYYE